MCLGTILQLINNFCGQLPNIRGSRPYMNYLKIFLDQVCQVSNILSGLEFVSSDHHHCHSRFLESGDGFRDSVLKFVLNCCSSKDVQMVLSLLDQLKLHLLDFLDGFTFVKLVKTDVLFLLFEFIELFLSHFPVTKYQSS